MIRVFQRSDSLWRTDFHTGESSYEINGRSIQSAEYRRRLSEYGTPNDCPFCTSRLLLEDTDGPRWFSPPVRRCAACGYWALGGHFTSSGGGAQSWHKSLYWCAKLEEYRYDDESIPIQELRAYVDSRPEEIRSISPKNLERLVADVYRSSGQYANVMHVGKPADGGVDVVLVQGDGEPVLVQVKQRAMGGTESVVTVRNLLGAMYREGALRGAVVSTADAFSWHAIREASGNVERLGVTYVVELVDEGKLSAMLTDTASDPRPWEFGLSMLHID